VDPLCKIGMSYELKKIKVHEGNYATHDLELTTIIHALKMWRHYLMGWNFELTIDHNGLKYSHRQIRWLEFPSEFGFDINNIKGNKNKEANTLNIKRVHVMHDAITIIIYNIDLKRIILEYYDQTNTIYKLNKSYNKVIHTKI